MNLLPTFLFISLVFFTNGSEAKALSEEDFTVTPVQHVKKVSGKYVTYKDVQAGDPDFVDEDEAKKLACIPRESVNNEMSENDDDTINHFGAEDETNEDGESRVFNDTTVFNGTDVNEVMEVRIYKPLCDD